ncbi:MAG: T9SS type A sorting domain-containing protein [Ignavibacteria bacterium]
MKNTFKLFVTLFLLALTLNSSYAIPPTFNMTITNVVTQPNGVTGADSVVQFDVNMLWTNSLVPGVDPYEYGSNQLDITFNPNIANGGTLAASRVTALPPGGLPSLLQTPTVQVIPNPDGSGNMLFQGSSIVPNGANNFNISDVFPGTCIGRFKIRTSSHTLGLTTADFKFQLTPPNNTFPAYMLPPLDPDDPDNQLAAGLMDTVVNHYLTEQNPVLPVELASFTSSTNKNTVALTWATTRETNNQGFDIERSVVGTTDWSKAGYVAGNGTVTETKNYTFSERLSAPGHYSYRLKQIDFNGNVEYFVLNGEVEVGIPSVYSVSQNYPNPFNPSTKIDYDIPYDGKVSILLYDISGREVGKLVNEVKTAGYYTVQFNASNLSSGMYFYRITAQGNSQNFTQTKKMVLIK